MEIDTPAQESQNPNSRVQAEISAPRIDHKSIKKCKGKEKIKAKAAAAAAAAVPDEEVEEEGDLLLDLPTFSDMGNGRLRCVETGHELPVNERDAYSRSKACRLALINAAVAAKKPPLNVFKSHPTSKSQLLCQLTGDTVNKTEKHIWKHINGKRFLNKLEQKEMEKLSPVKSAEKDTKISKKQQKKAVLTSRKKDQEKLVDQSQTKTTDADNSDLEEPDFWAPPVGDRWDFDDGNQRWDSSENLDDEKDNNSTLGVENKIDDSEVQGLQKRTKRKSKAIGPSSFASRQKKAKKNSQ